MYISSHWIIFIESRALHKKIGSHGVQTYHMSYHVCASISLQSRQCFYYSLNKWVSLVVWANSLHKPVEVPNWRSYEFFQYLLLHLIPIYSEQLSWYIACKFSSKWIVDLCRGCPEMDTKKIQNIIRRCSDRVCGNVGNDLRSELIQWYLDLGHNFLLVTQNCICEWTL